MQKYNYNKQVAPPAPFVHLQVGRPKSTEVVSIPALIDTGADLTMISAGVLAARQVEYGRELQVEVATGTKEVVQTAVVELAIRGLSSAISLEVGRYDCEGYSLLGRDYVNHYRITFDGPNQNLVIEE